MSFRKFWPYDEVTAYRDAALPSRYWLAAPWLKFQVDIAPEDRERAEGLFQKLASGGLSAGDVGDLQWFFAALADFPLC